MQQKAQSTMMNYQLTIPSILRRARDVHPHKSIVTKMNDESIHRETYGTFYRRTRQLMDALRKAGMKPGDRIGTLGMNHYRHLEIYFAAPSTGSVLHTINVRLFPEQLIFIINNAADRIIFVDKSLTKAIAPHVGELKGVERFVIIDDLEAGDAAPLPNSVDYEAFLATGDPSAADTEDHYQVQENDPAGLCYTSGTTGNPRGVLYSHRSVYLHSMGICMADTLAVSERECILPVVPMFHVNAWGIPFAAVMTGARLVFPGKHLLGAALASLLEQEQVTITAGVPTIWNVLLQYLRKSKHDLSKLHTMVVGGSAAPKAMIEAFDKEFGISILHAWGMTELSPVGTVSRLRSSMQDWPYEKQLEMRGKQGPAVAGVEIRAIDDHGKDVPRDGKTSGEMIVRGPWVTGSYFGIDGSDAFTQDGWFRTGDVVSIDEHGYVLITDRKKDLIKTRGEWISSVEMENLVLRVSGVLEAAVVARNDDVRGEVPVVFVVPQEGEKIERRAVIEELKKSFAHWQLPHQDDVQIIEAIPKTSVGKFDKKVLRARLAEQE